MNPIRNTVTERSQFFKNTNPLELVQEFGSPLYVYNETILRKRCRELKNLVSYPHFSVNYSVKANNNLTLLKIIRDEGLNVDAMSPGEIFIEKKAGFLPEQILYISNNVSEEEMKYAIQEGVTISVDSLSQLEQLGRIHSGGKVCVRFNSGVGAGHHEKVITGGEHTKFGIHTNYIPQVKQLIKKYNLQLIGINQHIGSLFMESKSYLEGVRSILNIAQQFENLEFVDLGGGFGIPYHKYENEPRLNLQELGKQLDQILYNWTHSYGKDILFKVEPGRYIVAECGLLLGTIHSIKQNSQTKYIGTDLGFNVLIRPTLYDSHHDIEIYRASNTPSLHKEKVTIVGNICESGDIIAKDCFLPQLYENDILGVLDAGAYGYCMSSNYNNRLRPAEVLIRSNGDISLIRRRDTLEDLLRNFEV